MLRTLCTGLRGLFRAAALPTPPSPLPAAAFPVRRAFSAGSGNDGDGSSSKSSPAHWDRSGGLPETAAGPGTATLTPAPAGVALATHMLLNQPTYNVLGDVVPINEYHLTEELPGGGGAQFYTLPVVHLAARRNNCIATLADSQGRALAITSTGIEGFTNARKSTTVAAQVVGVSIALKAKKLGIGHVRVMIRGMNQLRLACLKGMLSGGLQLASVTDNTKIHYGKGRRPRKPPRK